MAIHAPNKTLKLLKNLWFMLVATSG